VPHTDKFQRLATAVVQETATSAEEEAFAQLAKDFPVFASAIDVARQEGLSSVQVDQALTAASLTTLREKGPQALKKLKLKEEPLRQRALNLQRQADEPVSTQILEAIRQQSISPKKSPTLSGLDIFATAAARGIPGVAGDTPFFADPATEERIVEGGAIPQALTAAAQAAGEVTGPLMATAPVEVGIALAPALRAGAAIPKTLSGLRTALTEARAAQPIGAITGEALGTQATLEGISATLGTEDTAGGRLARIGLAGAIGFAGPALIAGGVSLAKRAGESILRFSGTLDPTMLNRLRLGLVTIEDLTNPNIPDITGRARGLAITPPARGGIPDATARINERVSARIRAMGAIGAEFDPLAKKNPLQRARIIRDANQKTEEILAGRSRGARVPFTHDLAELGEFAEDYSRALSGQIFDRIPTVVRSEVTRMFGSNELVVSAARRYQSNTTLLENSLEDLAVSGAETLKLSERLVLGQVLRGDAPLSALTSKEAHSILKDYRGRILGAGYEAVDRGLIEREIVENNADIYLRNSYLANLIPGEINKGPQSVYQEAVKDYSRLNGVSQKESASILDQALGASSSPLLEEGAGALSLNTSSFLQRAKLSPAIRQYLGLVNDGVLASANTLSHVRRAVLQNDFAREVAASLPVVSEVTDEAFTVFNPANISPIQKRILGPLIGKPMPISTAAVVEDVILSETMSHDWVDKLISKMKLFKVVGNPPSYMRSFVGNSFFAMSADINPLNPVNVQWYRLAAEGLGNPKSDLGRELIESGYSRGFVDVPTKQILKKLAREEARETGRRPGKLAGVWDKMLDLAFSGEKLAANKFTWTDSIYKAAMYLKATRGTIDAGRAFGGVKSQMTKASARQIVAGTFPTFSEVPRAFGLARVGRKFPKVQSVIAPYMSFPVEAIRNFSFLSNNHPMRLAGVIGGLTAYHQWGWSLTGADRKSIQQAKKAMPKQYRFPNKILVPVPFSAGFTDKGRPQMVDLTHIFPLGDIFSDFRAPEDLEDGDERAFRLAKTFAGNFLTSGFAMQRGGASQDFSENGIENFMSSAIETAVPSLTPGLGSGFKRLQRNLETEGRGFLGQQKSFTQEAIDVFTGIKVLQADPERFRQLSAIEVKSQKKNELQKSLNRFAGEMTNALRIQDPDKRAKKLGELEIRKQELFRRAAQLAGEGSKRIQE